MVREFGTGAQPDVPHALDNRPDGFPGLLFRLLIRKSKQHVDVGVREQVLASVAAQRQQGNILRRLACERPAPHFNQDTVNYSGAAADRSGAVPGPLTGLADERHLPEILIPKIVNR